ncbi:hypothetical protein [Streptomyces sp. KR80]|uniref:hypothetical protein n=1 Tax=Streptomyces sp. KR80 TaxID=3457426 RepID=UPI003FCFAC89
MTAQREELVVAERVLVRLNEQPEAEAYEALAPAPGQTADRVVLLVPHRERAELGVPQGHPGFHADPASFAGVMGGDLS